MIFSLQELDKAFPNSSSKQKRRVLREIRKIKSAYRRQRGIFKAMKLTNKKILRKFTFYDYDCFCMFQRQDTMENWDNFVDACTAENGAELLDCYI